MVLRKYGKKGKGQRVRKLLHFEAASVGNNINYVVGLETFHVASCGEWLLMVNYACGRETFLWNPNACQKIQLPRMAKRYCFFSKCIVSAPPTQQQCAVLFFFKDIPHILYCRVGDTQWTNWRYPNANEPSYVFYEAISCNGRMFALNAKGLHEILLRPKECRLKFYDSEEPLIYASAEEDHLVDSCGDLFLVRRFSLSELEVFKMDFSCQEWVHVQSLGDRVLFLNGYYSLSSSATELGIEGNCIYFTEDDNESLYLLNFEDKSLSVSPHQLNSGALGFSYDGFVPILRLIEKPVLGEHSEEEVKFDTKKLIVVEDVNEDEEENSIYLNLPMHLQEFIAKRIAMGRDYMNFRLVCRKWRSLAPPCRWCYNSSARCTTIPNPWLMFFGKEKDNFNFCDPRENVTYHKKISSTKELSPDCVIRYAKDGWLLVSHGAGSIFCFHPFTKARIQLPDLPVNYCMRGICFSAINTKNRAVVGIATTGPFNTSIFYLRPTRKHWRSPSYRNDTPFHGSRSNPVFLDGSFYCLGRDGSLGVFELNELTWKILSKPQPLIFPSKVCQSFLIFSNEEEELLSVFVGNLGKWVHVYKLDKSENEWVKLSNLGNDMLFVNQTASLAVVPKDENMKNKIYFPIFSKINGSNLFYSLETCTFQNFEEERLIGDLYDTKELLNCAWVQPRLVPTF